MAALPPFQALLDEHGADGAGASSVASLGAHDARRLLPGDGRSARCGPTRRCAGPTTCKSWLFTIAHHKAIDHHRRVARRRRGRRRRGRAGRGRAAEPVDEDLWPAVAACPPSSGSPSLQRYVADLAYAEIAEILDCSEAAARQNVRAGLASLRTSLDKEPQP